jgi:hypothetical protein
MGRMIICISILFVAIFLLFMGSFTPIHFAGEFEIGYPIQDQHKIDSLFEEACGQLYSQYNCSEEHISTALTKYYAGNKNLTILNACQLKFSSPGMDVEECINSCESCNRSIN